MPLCSTRLLAQDDDQEQYDHYIGDHDNDCECNDKHESSEREGAPSNFASRLKMMITNMVISMIIVTIETMLMILPISGRSLKNCGKLLTQAVGRLRSSRFFYGALFSFFVFFSRFCLCSYVIVFSSFSALFVCFCSLRWKKIHFTKCWFSSPQS